MSTRRDRLDWIQALRGLAALMVVMVHSRGAFTGEARRVLADQVLLPMAMGVDLFFIISGFLMVWTTRDFDGTRAYVAGFLAKRFARIWPLLVVITPVALVIEHGVGGFMDHQVVLSYLEGLAFIPHDPGGSRIYFHMAVGVAWTLCFEWYFYMVFAASMAFGRWRYLALLTWFALTLVAIPLARGNATLEVAAQPLVTWSRYANLAINPIVWDFVAGMAAAWLYGSRINTPSSRATVGITVVLLLLLWVVWTPMGMVSFFGPRGWGAPLAIAFTGIALLARDGGIRVPRWSLWLGGLSYSLYLVHVYVFEVVQPVVAVVPRGSLAIDLATFMVRAVLAIFCAWIIFRCVEFPLSTWARRRLLGLLAAQSARKGSQSVESGQRHSS